MGTAFAVLDIALGALGLVDVLGGLLQPNTAKSVVRLGIGIAENADGNRPSVSLYDVNGNYYGFETGSGKVGQGDHLEIKIEQIGKHTAGQAQYLQIAEEGGDAVCIAYATLTHPNSIAWAWYGDNGFFCRDHGFFWYNSNTVAGQGNFMPRCTWIDGDATNGISTKVINIHMASFETSPERVAAFNENPNLLCGSKPRFFSFTDKNGFLWDRPYFSPPLEYQPGTLLDKDTNVILDSAHWAQGSWESSPLEGYFKREERHNSTTEAPAVRAMKHWPDRGHLVKSKQPSHTASALCKDKMSYGPDFVSVEEGLFCDMEHRRLWPLCKNKSEKACFDTKTDRMRLGPGNVRRDEDGNRIIRKRYLKVDQW